MDTPYDVELGGIVLTVDKNVYPTSELSELVIECFDHPLYGLKSGDQVLDYGTGTGFLAIHAARRGATVLAIDINPDALACAEKNAEKNRVSDRITFRLSHNLQAVSTEESFDFITAGMPWDDAEPSDLLEYSVYDPLFQMKRDLFNRGHNLLKMNGCIFITYGETIQERYPIESFDTSYNYKRLSCRLI